MLKDSLNRVALHLQVGLSLHVHSKRLSHSLEWESISKGSTSSVASASVGLRAGSLPEHAGELGAMTGEPGAHCHMLLSCVLV